MGLELFGGNGSCVTENVRRELTVRVDALGALKHLDAVEQCGMLLQIGNGRKPDIRGHGMQALGALVVILDVAAHGDVGHPENIGKMTNSQGIVCKAAIGRHGK